MKNSMKALVVLTILAFAGMANAQNSASATGTANATIVCGIKLTPGTIAFGKLVSGTGTITMDNTGVMAYGGNTNPGTQGGSTSPATWSVTGQSGFLYNVTDDNTRAFVLSDGASPTPHTINGNANAIGNNPHTLSTTVNGGCGGTDSFKQGGSITLSGQPAGTYNTTNTGGSGWSETVTYN
jgi:hypothetical protein